MAAGKKAQAPRIFCIGNSHMACVLFAAEEARVPIDAFMFKAAHYFESLKRQPVELAKMRQLEEENSRLPRRGNVFSFIGGTKYLSTVIRTHPQPFDFVLPRAPELPVEPGAEIVPVDALRAMLAWYVREDLHRLETIVGMTTGRVYQFEPPPPATDKSFREQQSRPGWKPDTPQYLRYKLWRLHSEIVVEVAERMGVVFVEHPAEAVDEEGFLRAEFVENMTHANAKYGRLVLEQIRSLA